MRPGDKDGPFPDATAILDAVIDLVAEEEAENGEPTEQDIQWSRDLRRKIQARIAVLRRQLTSVEPVDPPAAPMGHDVHAIHALDRADLLARLKAVRPGDGAHHALASLSDEDLRGMLARLTGPTEGETP